MKRKTETESVDKERERERGGEIERERERPRDDLLINGPPSIFKNNTSLLFAPLSLSLSLSLCPYLYIGKKVR
jgi:hypothetical protein